MKHVLFFISIALLLSFNTKRDKKFIPPGTVQITEALFADETEVSNRSWKEYEYWIKTKFGTNSKEHIEILPDTLVWRRPESCNEPYVKHYYRHPAYNNFPVLGVSYEQVVKFCKWRTERVKEFYSIAHKKTISIEYRLPTKREWEFISNNGASFIVNGGKNKKGEALFNHRWMTDNISKKYFSEHNQHPDVTVPTNSFQKNPFGLYCMFGNVAEMVAEEGISKGGSWINTFEECRAGKDLNYSTPNAWLGFRCVCSVRPGS